MAARGLAFEWVERTLRDPERTVPDSRDPRLMRCYRGIEAAQGRVLRVVYRLEGDDIIVVTAFFDRKAAS